MALIKCKECKTEISSKAETCPKCGVRVAEQPMGCATSIVRLIYFVLLGVFALAILSFIFSDKEKKSSDLTETSNSIPVSQIPKSPESQLPGSQWAYAQSDDGMSKNTAYHALVSSINTVNFDSPYDGDQHGTLGLRTHPRYGKDVIFKIEKGQILCHSYEDCTVLVRFDDEKAINFNAASAADNSTETIFIRNYNKFVEKMLKAKKVRISLNIYQEGSPVFEFDVSGFNNDKYKPKK
jgi:hypothetical protein